MKLEINESAAAQETVIQITCRQIDDNVLRIAAAVRALEQKLLGEKDGRTFVVEPKDVLYFESVDKHTFLYTVREVYQTPLRLYEIEDRYAGGDFFRASKAQIVNMARVRQLQSVLGGRIEVLLENGEKLVVSRQYVPALRKKLGM